METFSQMLITFGIIEIVATGQIDAAGLQPVHFAGLSQPALGSTKHLPSVTLIPCSKKAL